MIEETSVGMPATDSTIADGDAEMEKFFGDGHNSQRILYTEWMPILREKNIRVRGVVHHQYLELYALTRDAESAAIRFWYDGLCCFTKAEPHLAGCNSDGLLMDIEATIAELKKR